MRRELTLLDEMIDSAQQAMVLVQGVDADALAGDRVRRDALLWNFSVLGEASAQLPVAFKQEHPSVDWARPTQLRNRIVHSYWSVDLDILVATAEHDLPGFVEHLHDVRAAGQGEPHASPGGSPPASASNRSAHSNSGSSRKATSSMEPYRSPSSA